MEIGTYVVVRTHTAGVHAGTLASLDGEQVTLDNAKRIWSWKGANTLHEIALYGVDAGSRLSQAVSQIVLTGAIEIIAATDAARENLRESGWAK
jgi:hypothetical protein